MSCDSGGVPLTERHNFSLEELRPTLPFGQVPLLEDGPIKFAQSGAILRYLAHKGNLDGRDNPSDFAINEMLIEEYQELYGLFAKAQYAPEGKTEGWNKLVSEGSVFHKQLQYLENLLVGDHFSSRILSGDCKTFILQY